MIDDINDISAITTFFQEETIVTDSIVIVFWSFEENSDLFVLNDLLRNWNNVFHAIADDAWVIYFPSISKLFMFTHYGEIKTRI